jgi:hypothetical protein
MQTFMQDVMGTDERTVESEIRHHLLMTKRLALGRIDFSQISRVSPTLGDLLLIYLRFQELIET